MPYRNKEIQLAYQRKHYRKHRQQVISKVAERKKKMRRWFQNYKRGLECNRCGFGNSAALDFHHLSDKEAELSQVSDLGWGRERIMKEVAKCEVLCANCHRIEHAPVAQSG